eukprot:TRINITY_DN107_c0_g1_i23.p1 TRINITY_DN107_c0_g1~~TRINITY_DN107_c0_g1_i23.p1  ORF type:complete len:244 (+),score=14.85 TRINITY_DN107_c0_g1_i23:52-783(+)
MSNSCIVVRKAVIAKGSEFPIVHLRFETRGQTLDADPGLGQSLKLFNSKTGRKYSPVEVDENGFSLAVKIYEGGKMSEYLNRVTLGQEMWWKAKPAWKNGKTRRCKGENVLLVAMGIGITAVLPVCERELSVGASGKVLLLYCNRTKSDEIWIDELNRLSEKYPKKFSFVRHLTREAPLDSDVSRGISNERLTTEALASYLVTCSPSNTLFYVVGSKQQKKSLQHSFASLGYFKENCSLFVSS